MLNLKDLSFVLIRILSVFIFIKGLEHLINITQLLIPVFMHIGDTFNGGVILLISLLTGIFLLIISCVIWIKADWIVIKINRTRQMNDQEVRAMKDSEWYALGLTLVGIYLIVDTLPNLISLIGQQIQDSMNDYPAVMDFQRDRIWLQIGVTTLKLILALVLVLRVSGLAGLLSKIRDMGINKNETLDQ